ncbi:hypothetical protein FO440_22575 [Mucilaginibacter corticis]|uniref:Lipocalin-like domain-containing protein n=1 Tax=Mucilaginibacter corticis TaxID=2597670 RepID=A0A556M9Y0_9SPHI|nr:hypothetical protein [Mucilaginibacter corticis]TSJ36615.1 hypothetical protein FO440_22575 [Mucilaginibacter corticis]
MKLNLLLPTMVGILISTTIFAQSKKKTSQPSTTSPIGSWKLISQKVTYPDGQVSMGDSSNIFQHKILTPTTFVVTIEKKIPNYDNKKLAVSVAGGHYTLVNGDYEELTEYASFKGFETMKVNYKLTMEDGKLHTVGTLSGSGLDGKPTIYDEVYVRED